MDTASRDYSYNMGGASYVSQFLNRRRKKKGSAENPDNVPVCEKGKKCEATEGAGGATRQSNEGSGTTGSVSGAKGKPNEVMTKGEAIKWGEHLEKQRKKEAERMKKSSEFERDRSKA